MRRSNRCYHGREKPCPLCEGAMIRTAAAAKKREENPEDEVATIKLWAETTVKEYGRVVDERTKERDDAKREMELLRFRLYKIEQVANDQGFSNSFVGQAVR